MNKFFSMIATTLIGLYAVSAEAVPQPIVSATPVVILMPIVLNNPDFFDFTSEQKQKIALIAQKTNQVREDLDQSILDMRNELREEVSKYQPDAKLVAYLVKEVQTAENRRLQLSIDCADGLRTVMNAQQWKTLIELMQ